MKKLTLPLLIAMLTLSGCASQYVIKLNSGRQITSVGKPKLQGNAYSFKDAKGEKHLIAATRVREIEPASMASEETAPKNKSKAAKEQHKRHWYLLWLA